MPPRAMWTGQLRLSLVSFGVRMYAATESARRVSMNQLHKDCHQRVRNQLACPAHGTISRDDVVKGYEYEKDSYVIITAEDLDSIKLPSSKTIDLVQFVDAGEIDAVYINAPYYLGPDGPVAEEAFRVIREAMSRSGKVGLGKLVMHGREHIVALSVQGKGFLMTTLRYAAEVRGAGGVFADIKDGEVDEEQVKLAESIMKSKTASFDPARFTDHYQEAFFEIVKAKIEGEAPVFVEQEEAPPAFNFMDALKKSVAQAEKPTGRKKPAAKSGKTAAKTSRKKPPAKSVGAAAKKKGRKRA
jgi:DNA end-binding protein Ku